MAIMVQVTFDCADPEALAGFWASVLGYEKDWTWDEATTREMLEGGLDPSAVGSRCAVHDPEGRGPRLYFQRVPEEKQTKNRVHLDLRVGPARIDEEITRLQELGATLVHDGAEPFGPFPPQRHAILTDPEGNELCVG
jgi:catechol 2,3-dioxygenase-like lactoylglutathione lyase family enzyme